MQRTELKQVVKLKTQKAETILKRKLLTRFHFENFVTQPFKFQIGFNKKCHKNKQNMYGL